jgi:hypothetical protein
MEPGLQNGKLAPVPQLFVADQTAVPYLHHRAVLHLRAREAKVYLHRPRLGNWLEVVMNLRFQGPNPIPE